MSTAADYERDIRCFTPYVRIDVWRKGREIVVTEWLDEMVARTVPEAINVATAKAIQLIERLT